MPAKIALPAKAKIAALVCSGRRRPNENQGAKLSAGIDELQGDEQPDQHADEAPDEGGDHELADDVVVVGERLEADGGDVRGGGRARGAADAGVRCAFGERHRGGSGERPRWSGSATLHGAAGCHTPRAAAREAVRRRRPSSGSTRRAALSVLPQVLPGNPLHHPVRANRFPKRAREVIVSISMTMSQGAASLDFPLVIQGGMGAGVSNWMLARAVSLRGQLGVVSGTVIDTIFCRRLQDGDVGGHLRRAMAHFPCPAVAEAALKRYFHPEGRAPGAPYKALPTYKQVVSAARQQLTMLASFVEVWLAKEGHRHPVGINLLTKVQMPNLATLYGAMLAGVDVVLMGAGIPREIPGALDALAMHQPAVIRFDVEAGGGDVEYLTFDPAEHGVPSSTACAEAPAVLPHRFGELARHDAGPQGQRPRGRIRDRGPDGRRAQRATARRHAALRNG